MPCLWPFKKYELDDFLGVHVPLAEAHRHPHAVAEMEKRQFPRINSVDNEQQTPRSTGSLSSGYSTFEELKLEVDFDVAADNRNSPYDRKSKVINKAIQDIGMGSYQWRLFILCGFGWLADNLWLQGLALTLPSLTNEFGVSTSYVRFTTFSVYCGLCFGAVFWGTVSDVVGRRLAFNVTLLITGVFGLAVAFSRSWTTVCSLYAALGFGVGGNLPVDGTLFLEFLPTSNGNLLTMLSVFWPLGQLLASLIAWRLIPQNSCDSAIQGECLPAETGDHCCPMQSNMGWRYLNITMGSITLIMFVCRFFLFQLSESPKFLLSRDRQREAILVVHAIAYQNGKQTWLEEGILDAVGGQLQEKSKPKFSIGEIARHKLGQFSRRRMGPLFGSKKLGFNTVLLWLCWATIGLGYPLFNAFLPQYLINVDPAAPKTPTNIVYRNYAIVSLVGVPGSILAWYTVDVPHIGRKGTMAISAALTGAFLFIFTKGTDSTFQLTFTCLEAFFQNIMYGVLYAYTPEIFPAPNRGTGTGIASFLNRIAGLCAPLIGIYASTTSPKVPIYVSGALILSAAIAICLFPIESRGRQTL